MPELLGSYEQVCALVGEDDLAPQIPHGSGWLKAPAWNAQ